VNLLKERHRSQALHQGAFVFMQKLVQLFPQLNYGAAGRTAVWVAAGLQLLLESCTAFSGVFILTSRALERQRRAQAWPAAEPIKGLPCAIGVVGVTTVTGPLRSPAKKRSCRPPNA